MTITRQSALAFTGSALLLLSACAGAPSQSTLDSVRAGANPADRPQRTITNFTPALRCMDDMMFRHGTRDVTLMMEELRDATQKVPVSARDMMTSAISEMTRRSRAVRLSVFGGDQSNLMQVLQGAQRSNVFAVVPEFNVRGTISQFDEDVKKQGGSFGLLTERAFGVRLGNDTKFSVIGFDAAVVRTESLTLVPGVSSKNTTVIARRDAGAGDGQARILGAAAVFSFTAARAEGNAQAARNMVELAAIELVGKLIRTPYWQCLGTPDTDPEVQREMDDWFFSMHVDELTVFLKERLRERRYFDGGLDGSTDESYRSALRSYRSAMKQPSDGPLDARFFRDFITQEVAFGPLAAPKARAAVGPQSVAATSTPAPAGTAAAAAPVVAVAAPTPTPTPTPTIVNSAPPSVPNVGPTAAAAAVPAAEATRLPIQVFTQPARDGHVQLKVTVNAAGYMYCYAQDPKANAIRRIFPSRFVRDPRVEAGRAVTLPGEARFELSESHLFACVHAPSEVYSALPPPLRWGDFEDIRLPTFDEIRAQFALASGQPVAMARAVER